MIIEQTTVIKLNNPETVTIRDSADVLDDINSILQNDEAIKIYDTYYDKEFVTSVFAFMCDLRAHSNLTIVKNK